MIQQSHSWAKTIIWKNTGTRMFTAALFKIAKTWKQRKCPSTDKEDVYTHTHTHTHTHTQWNTTQPQKRMK